jgi:hypothetical protein
MTAPIEERALNQVVDFYLQADEEWLVRQTPTSLSYWLSGLETKIRSDKNDDGSVKLRSETVVVSDVTDPVRAEQLCSALNSLSPSWAYVYDNEDRVLSALSSVVIYVHETDDPPTFRGWEPSPFQDAWMILFAMSIWGHARMAMDIAQIAAELCRGKAAWSKPAHQPEHRDPPDVFVLLPDVLHQRPEWLRDYRPFISWPTPDLLAHHVARVIQEEIDSEFETAVEVLDDSASVSVSAEGNLISQWQIGKGIDLRYGVCGVTTALFGRPAILTNSAMANRANLLMWSLSNASQLGSWACDESAMRYTQAIPSAHVRALEDSAAKFALNDYNLVFFERLSARAAGVFDCVQELFGQTDSPEEASRDDGDVTELRTSLAGALFAAAEKSLSELDAEFGTPDPVVLRCPPTSQFFAVGMFNPFGPTVVSLEPLLDETGTSQLVEVQRHPFFPRVRKLGKATDNPEFDEILQIALRKSVTHLPSYIDLTGCPDGYFARVSAVFKQHLLEVAIELQLNIPALTERLQQTIGDPWSRIAHELPELPSRSSEPTVEQIDKYFDVVTSQENLVPFWMELPNAWDGAINANLQNGLLDSSDIGPLVWRYNHSIGLPSQ